VDNTTLLSPNNL